VFVDAIKALFLQGIAAALFVLSYVRIRATSDMDRRGLLVLLAVVLGVGALAASPMFLKALWLLLRHGSVGGSLRQVGKALLRALVRADAIDTDVNQMRVVVEKAAYETLICRLEGGTTREKSVFLDALGELLGPIRNPRYLLLRKSRLGALRRTDYHAVPTVLGRKKAHAAFLAKMWKKYVGSTGLIYTRNTEGRRALLKARGRSLATAMQKKSERRNRWS